MDSNKGCSLYQQRLPRPPREFSRWFVYNDVYSPGFTADFNALQDWTFRDLSCMFLGIVYVSQVLNTDQALHQRANGPVLGLPIALDVCDLSNENLIKNLSVSWRKGHSIKVWCNIPSGSIYRISYEPPLLHLDIASFDPGREATPSITFCYPPT